jgi:hypothetical protein
VPEPTLKVAKVAPVGVAEPEDSKGAPDPKAPCPACGGGRWWQPQQGGGLALPLMPACNAIDGNYPHLTLSSAATASAGTNSCPLDPLLEYACKGLAITPKQPRQALEDTDLPALASGELTLKALRLTAWTLVLAHHGLPDRRADQRRREGLSLLAQAADIDHAMVSVDDADRDAALVTLAIKGKTTCELRVPKARDDGFALVALLGRADP